MLLIKSSFTIDSDMRSGDEILHRLRLKANTCYKPEKVSPKNDLEFMYDLVHIKKHTSVLRHEQASMKLVCSRAVSHQIVRHGLAHFLQESQRYCNYSKKGGGHVVLIIPFYLHDKIKEGVVTARTGLDVGDKCAYLWLDAMLSAEHTYHAMIQAGYKPERARGVLPEDAKTEVCITANLEEWRHIFRQRADSHADESMQFLIRPALAEFKNHIPVIFDDLGAA